MVVDGSDIKASGENIWRETSKETDYFALKTMQMRWAEHGGHEKKCTHHFRVVFHT